MQKYILKSRKYYKDIKLTKGLNLSNYQTIFRNGDTGVSCIKFGHLWFLTPKGKALFKTYDGNITKIRITNELLYNYLAKKVGINVAEYIPAHKNKKVGLVSYDFVKPGQQLVPLYEFIYQDLYTYTELVQHFELHKEKFEDVKKLEFDLFKVMVLDALTFHEDRHNNLSFLRKIHENKYELAPIFDNEHAFAGITFSWSTFYFKKLTTEKLLKEHGANLNFLCDDEVVCMYNNKEVYAKNVERIVSIAMTKPTYKYFLQKALKKYDIDEAIAQVEKKGYSISPYYKEFLQELSDIAKQTFKRAIIKNKNMVENNEYNSADFNATR